MHDGIVTDTKTQSPDHVRQLVDPPKAERLPPPRATRAAPASVNAEVPLTPAAPNVRAYWSTRTAAEAEAAGVAQIVACRDAVWTPLVLEPF